MKLLKIIIAIGLFLFLTLTGFKIISAIETKQYQGASACGDCHKKQYELWLKTAHAKAFDVLPEPKKSDLTCLWCHSTDGRDNFKSFKLKGVQCEACHGAGISYSYGVASEGFVEAHKKRLRKQDDTVCIDCHSKDRTPSVGIFNYSEKIQKIKHWEKKDKSAEKTEE